MKKERKSWNRYSERSRSKYSLTPFVYITLKLHMHKLAQEPQTSAPFLDILNLLAYAQFYVSY